MGEAARAPGQIISLPQGGGALRGIGEKFAPDLQTGTGNFTVPIAVPAGRRGLEPKLDLTYSTGSPNSFWGLGWSLTVPGVSRKTSHGIPTYDDRRDTFILSGSEDLVPMDPPSATTVRYRPRTEGLFARIIHHRHRASRQDYWEVTSRDGLISRYGTPRPEDAEVDWHDPAVLADPDNPTQVFAWKLTETRDPFGNLIRYGYDTDQGETGGHHWRQPRLRTIRYVDYDAADGSTQFLASVTLDYEPRQDPFSSYTAGFEIRTTWRCSAITTAVHTETTQPVRRYELGYEPDPYNAVSLLRAVKVVGFDDAGEEHRELPQLELGYTRFQPEHRRFEPVHGADPPPGSLTRGDYELVDCTGDGLPDVLELNGVARYWRNLGGGVFDRPRRMRDAPSGLRLADPGVQLLDADGDARADLLVTTPTGAGYFPLRFNATWGRFRPYRSAPGFNLEDPEVRLLDLDGDRVTDAIRAGPRLTCFFNDPETGWTGPQLLRQETPDGPPALSLADPRVKWADMTGDGSQDLVLVHDGTVEYWPNLGRGRWGRRLRMAASPRLPYGYDPRRLLLGDVDGDGLADLVYVGDYEAMVWVNRSGNSWSLPITVDGCPGVGASDSLRITDLHGTGTGGVLWSRDAPAAERPAMFFLDLTSGAKPRLLNEINNNIGAVTRIGYVPSTRFALADSTRAATRWRTPLPFVVPVVAQVEMIDQVSGGKLTTKFTYRHGYWDGQEREFRGFGCVEQLDTENFDAYHRVGLQPGTSFTPVERRAFSPPTLTRTWFHLGEVDTEDGDWTELDYRGEYWPGDPNLLAHSQRVTRFLRGLRDPAGRADRRARRDGLRSLRGRVLRSELYARDGSSRQHRPYTVTEHAYDLREEPAISEPGRPRVFSAFEVARRATQWERGADPMTRFTFTGDHDPYGQPRRQTMIVPPRRSAYRQPLTTAVVGTFVPDEQAVLATHVRKTFAEPDPGVYLQDRVAQVRTYELVEPPTVDEHDTRDARVVLADQLRAAKQVLMTFDRSAAGEVRLIGHVLHHYDGPGFTGLDFTDAGAGQAGRYGMLTRTETLVFTDDILKAAYGMWRPAYLGGPAPGPAGAPPGFGEQLGYRHEAAGRVYAGGWYADTLRQACDFQRSTPDRPRSARGVVVGVQDPLGHQTDVVPDRYWLLPTVVRDPAGLVTTATYDYQAGRPREVVDPNWHATSYHYHPLGLLSTVVLRGRDGEGGSGMRPEIRYDYDLAAYHRAGQPIHVHTTRRVWHASYDMSDEVIESREYSDGFGRLIQLRAQADALGFGADGNDVALLVPDADGKPQSLPGQTWGPAIGQHIADRVVVSGWQVYDNKGQIIERYEPFFDRGWAYQPEQDAQRGRRVEMYYDPCGRVVRLVNPDASLRRTVFGIPADLADPDDIEPTPWAVTAYDENDLAPRSIRPDGTSLATAASVDHHFTPATTILDALGRAICQIARGGTDRTADSFATRTSYDLRGNLLVVTDELGREAFLHVYDLTDRPLSVTSIDGGKRISVLDAAGNLVQTRDDRGCVALRTFDRLNRLAELLASDRPEQELTLRERVTYGDGGDPNQHRGERAAARLANRLGRVWHHHDEAGLLSVDAYDSKGNATERTRRVISDSVIAAAESAGGWTANWAANNAESALDGMAYRTTTRYDALNRVIDVTTPADVSGHRARIIPTYSRSGRLRAVTVDDTPYVDWVTHNARNQRVFVAYGNRVMTRYAYDPDTFRLVRMRSEGVTVIGDSWTAEGAPLQDLTYSYDLIGNVTSIEERTPGCGVARTRHGRDRLVRRFGYDPLYRLASASGRACANILQPRPFADTTRCGAFGPPYPSGPPTPNQGNAPDLTQTYTEAFRYDPAGNLVDLGYRTTNGRWRRRFGLGGRPPTQWAAALDNRLTSVHTGSDTRRLAFDDSGNLKTEDTDRTYTWDHAGRLVGFRIQAGTRPTVVARYLYGADGIRVKKWVRRGSSSGTDESIAYVDRQFEHHRWAKSGGGENNQLHVLDGTSRIASVRSGPAHPDDAGPATRYELADHVGSAAVTLDEAGGWLSREEFFAYGETSFGGFARKRYRFTGKERDEESSLAYHSARYYAPHLARWASCDPAGSIDGANLYRYARSNPATCQDASGTQTTSELGVPPGVEDFNDWFRSLQRLVK